MKHHFLHSFRSDQPSLPPASQPKGLLTFSSLLSGLPGGLPTGLPEHEAPPHSESAIPPFDGRFTEWDEAIAANDHAYPHTPVVPVKSAYERFGEECATKNILPSLELFEHWLDSDALENATGQYLGHRHN